MTTLRDAARQWVDEFNAVPTEMIETLMKDHTEDWEEVTYPSCGSRVFAWKGEYRGGEGYIDEICDSEENETYHIVFDDREIGDAVFSREEFDLIYYDTLPMWGWMWSFGDSADNYWLEEKDGIRLMSRCGFRIYEHKDWGYYFGIDGMGYSFMPEHWIPLYRARGLQWHDVDDIEQKTHW